MELSCISVQQTLNEQLLHVILSYMRGLGTGGGKIRDKGEENKR